MHERVMIPYSDVRVTTAIAMRNSPAGSLTRLFLPSLIGLHWGKWEGLSSSSLSSRQLATIIV